MTNDKVSSKTWKSEFIQPFDYFLGNPLIEQSDELFKTAPQQEFGLFSSSMPRKSPMDLWDDFYQLKYDIYRGGFSRPNQDGKPDKRILVLVGDPGSGKTSIIARWLHQFKETQPQTVVRVLSSIVLTLIVFGSGYRVYPFCIATMEIVPHLGFCACYPPTCSRFISDLFFFLITHWFYVQWPKRMFSIHIATIISLQVLFSTFPHIAFSQPAVSFQHICAISYQPSIQYSFCLIKCRYRQA